MAKATNKENSSIVKIAVTLEGKDINYLDEFDITTSLDTFIGRELRKLWDLQNPCDYMLQFKEPPHHYLTQANKHMLKSGTVLNLVRSAPLVCNDVLVALNLLLHSEGHRASVTIDHLTKICTCPTFANYFADNEGFKILLDLMMKLTPDDALLPTLLHIFTELLNTAINVNTKKPLEWDICPEEFVEKMVLVVNTHLPMPGLLVLRCMIVLDNIINNSQIAYTFAEKSLQLLQLMQKLDPKKIQAADVSVQRGVQRVTLTLIIALINRAHHERREHYLNNLSTRQYRNYITDILCSIEGVQSDDTYKMKCLLHKLQQFQMNKYAPRLNIGVSTDDEYATNKILQLRNVAFGTDVEARKKTGSTSSNKDPHPATAKKEYEKLGFKNDNPAEDFNEVPPGALALDNMYYFCHERPDQYSKLVLENCYRPDDPHECPIGKSSIELTKLLAKIFMIGEPPKEDCPDYHPMLYTNDNPFEETFCICLGLLNKTWKEMKATTEDINKVVRVVQEQIERALHEKPPNLDRFQELLQGFTYVKITEIWHLERIKTEQQEMNAPQIQKLKEKLREDIIEVVQQQRLKILEEGARFKNPNKQQRRDKYFFCRLSPNHKFFHYEECDEKATKVPPLDDLSKKVSVAEIKSVAVGKECPSYNLRRKCLHTFSLILESGKLTEHSSIDFAANDEETLNLWHDGIKVLLKEKMSSASYEKDVEMLLDMEIKLQLLDLEGVTIPSEVPPVPPLPANLNFCCNL